jgi:hypothetical protein
MATLEYIAQKGLVVKVRLAGLQHRDDLDDEVKKEAKEKLEEANAKLRVAYETGQHGTKVESLVTEAEGLMQEAYDLLNS